jgi:hypothetical protein
MCKDRGFRQSVKISDVESGGLISRFLSLDTYLATGQPPAIFSILGQPSYEKSVIGVDPRDSNMNGGETPLANSCDFYF